jgi:hypothetical protein
MKLEINNSRRKTRMFTSIWKSNNILLKNKWLKDEIKRKIRKYLETNNLQHIKT